MSNVVLESSIPPPSHELSTDDHGIQVASLCTGFKFFQRVFLTTSRSNSELKIAQLPVKGSTLATWIDLMTQNSWIIRCGNPAQSPRFVKDEREW
ncbi:hypothetical protein MCOR34_000564 [Pyricularia oryzae]|nr:hypothetical protein MCOR34_000564 [Pyricularia oryzae]